MSLMEWQMCTACCQLPTLHNHMSSGTNWSDAKHHLARRGTHAKPVGGRVSSGKAPNHLQNLKNCPYCF